MAMMAPAFAGFSSSFLTLIFVSQGKEILVQTADEDHGKLQPFGRVHRRKGYLFRPQTNHVGIGLKGDTKL